jgi:uncharacterized protein YyaL (SSP411 family)
VNIEAISSLAKHYGSFLSYDLAKLYLCHRSGSESTIGEHIQGAIKWICNAQDAFGDGGVARSYSMTHHPYFKRRGWIPSYPETTGYIIPTMFDYAHRAGRDEIADRAVRMADWECRVQMENGAVQGGTIDQPPTPAIFNTGQVIFGWIRAFQETARQRYLDCAIKAARFLVAQQEEDGSWRKSLSRYASSNMSFYTYNTRTAWALLELYQETGIEEFKNSAVRNVEFALGQQNENGWFRSNCLHDPSQPLVHTIAYCVRGVLEIGARLRNDQYIARARKAADALLIRRRPDGSLAGRFNERWEPTVTWRCLTGEAQMAGIWGRLYQLTGKHEYYEGLKTTAAALRRVQFMRTEHQGIYGGISGAEPIHGRYGQYEVLNWAVKFFVDAQMLEQSLAEKTA